jgi:chromosomal replication initiation ATPase DnaA
VQDAYAYDEVAMMNGIRDWHMEKRTNKPSRREQQQQAWQRMIAKAPTQRKPINSLEEVPVAARHTIDVVCKMYGLRVRELTEVSNRTRIATPRHVAAYLLVKVMGQTHAAAAQALGGMHILSPAKSIRRVCYLRAVNQKFANDLEILEGLVRMYGGGRA